MDAVCPTAVATTAASAAVAERNVLRLGARDLHVIAEPGDIVIRCTGGAAWVTQAGVADDVVLEPGGSVRPRAAGKVIVQPLTRAATLSIEPR